MGSFKGLQVAGVVEPVVIHIVCYEYGKNGPRASFAMGWRGCGSAQVPLRSLPRVKMRFTPGPECPVGLANMTTTRSTPEISSVTCAVKLTVAGLVVVFTAIGLERGNRSTSRWCRVLVVRHVTWS